MDSYERNEVIVDQCTECKGLFLDRGELEKLVAAESAWYGSSQPAAAGAPPRSEPAAGSPPGSQYGTPYQPRYQPFSDGHRRRDDDDDDDDDHRGGYRGHDPRGKKHRRRSFLEELFD